MANPWDVDPRFMKGGSLYQGAVEKPQDNAANQFFHGGFGQAMDYVSLINPVTAGIWHGAKGINNLVNPRPQATQPTAMDSAPAATLKESSSSAMAPINDKTWDMINTQDPEAQWIRDEQRKRYAALTDPNNPELRRAASLAGESAMAAARRAGVRGGYGINAGENAYNRAYQDQYMQRQQLAQAPLSGMASQVNADRDFVMRGLQLLGGNKLQEMGIDLQKVQLLLDDERYRTELKLALEQRDWNRVFQVLNTGMEIVGMARGGGAAGAKKAGF